MTASTDHVQIERLLNRDQCDRLVCAYKDSTNINNHHYMDEGAGRHVRDTEVTFVRDNDSFMDIFERIREVVHAKNAEYYNFDIWLDRLEAMQLAQYGVGQEYSWHRDLGAGPISGRKLSLCVQLTDPDLYTGGGLEFFRSFENIASAPRGLGDAVLFPSFITHRVAPVSIGKRHSLVAWVTGPPFR